MKLDKSESFKNFKGKEQIQMGLDLENTHSIMSLLRNNIYSDPIKSWVREIYSNAVDAHARVNNTKDSIDIEIKPEKGDYVFVVRDYGPSMTKDIITNVYAKMGKSDKREGNTEMGGWGLGAKSPLAYTDHFWIETWTEEEGENIYRKWVQFIDPSRVGALSLLEEDSWVSGKTGTKVTIPFDKKDYNAVCSSLQYYLSYTDAKFRLGEGLEDFKIAREWYTHYGEKWAVDLSDDSSYWVTEINSGLAIVGDIPYPIECKTLFNYFNNNIEELIYSAHQLKPKYIKSEERNRELYLGFLSSLACHKFEIRVPIGSVDLNASREDLQYTDRTCEYLFKKMYEVFLGIYDFVRMDLVNHPNYPEACITYKNIYHGGIKKRFLDKVRWAKEDLAFDDSPPLFKHSVNSDDFCTYSLETVYKSGTSSTRNILKRGSSTRLITGVNKYEIVIQDTEYSNFSKFIKYYAECKNEIEKYNYVYLCITPKDLDQVYDWIIESSTSINLSELVADFKENAPVSSGNRAASGTFKVLTYRYTNVRPRAIGITSYFEYEEVPINPEEEMYFINKEEWYNSEGIFKELTDDQYHSSDINKCLLDYLSSKGINKQSLVFTPKVTRNFNDDNWVNLFDLLKDDYAKYNSHKEQYTKALYTVALVSREMPEFKDLDSSQIERRDSTYLSLCKFYQDSLEYLKENDKMSMFFSLLSCDLRLLNLIKQGTYGFYRIDNISEFGEYGSKMNDILNMYMSYRDKLKFLRVYSERRFLDGLEIYESEFTEYINLMEARYNLYINEAKKEPQDNNRGESEFKFLYNKLTKKYLQEV